MRSSVGSETGRLSARASGPGRITVSSPPSFFATDMLNGPLVAICPGLARGVKLSRRVRGCPPPFVLSVMYGVAHNAAEWGRLD